MRRCRASTADAAGAALLASVGGIEVVSGLRLGGIGTATPPAAVAVLAVLFGTLPLAVRRRCPIAAASVVCGAVLAQAVLLHRVSLVAGLLPLLVAIYSWVVHAGRLEWGAPAVGVLAVTAFAVGIPEERAVGEQLFGLFAVLLATGTGLVSRRRQQAAERAVAALRRVESESEAQTARALADERAAIARELHDVIAHGVSVMGVLAGGARVLVDRDPTAAKKALRTIESQARESVGELQRLLGVLRDDHDGADRTPQPGLLQVETLVEQMRATGLPVDLDVQGPRRSLPAGVDLAAYRIVQEALTNVLKHAGTTPADVQLCYESDAISLRVTNGGAKAPVRRAGHGLVGMRERVGLYGGSLQIGPDGTGRFTVAARIPVQDSA